MWLSERNARSVISGRIVHLTKVRGLAHTAKKIYQTFLRILGIERRIQMEKQDRAEEIDRLYKLEKKVARLQHELEIQRDMGPKLMGRDLDGLARSIRVDSHGNIYISKEQMEELKQHIEETRGG